MYKLNNKLKQKIIKYFEEKHLIHTCDLMQIANLRERDLNMDLYDSLDAEIKRIQDILQELKNLECV